MAPAHKKLKVDEVKRRRREAGRRDNNQLSKNVHVHNALYLCLFLFKITNFQDNTIL